jgi:acyl-CoA hydrolase
MLNEPSARLADLADSWPRAGRIVLCAEGPYEPDAALRGYLEANPPSLADPVHVVFGIRRTVPSLPTAHVPGLSLGAFVPGRGLRGIAELVHHRLSYDDICQGIAGGRLRFDTVLACTTPPDTDGVRSLGAVSGYLQLALDAADTIYIEEIDWLPRIAGAATLARSPSAVVASSHRRSTTQPALSAPFDDKDLQVARNIMGCIPADAVLAIGIGRVADALSSLLLSRDDLELVSGVIQPATRQLYEAGAFGSRDLRAMSVVGSDELLTWAAELPAVRLESSTRVHNPQKLMAIPRFVAVLGAMTVDRAGNINSELANGVRLSGLGGAPDFAAGAHGSLGGASIFAVRSTNGRGESRLVDIAAAQTVAGGNVDVVVTERGVAHLRGLDPKSRRVALEKIFPC